jgi:hypothetical protein
MADRVAALEREAAVLRRAISALDGDGSPVRSRVKSRRPAPVTIQVVVKALREAPGSRASMLALIIGAPPAEVTARLTQLEARGSVRREGLGWALVI